MTKPMNQQQFWLDRYANMPADKRTGEYATGGLVDSPLTQGIERDIQNGHANLLRGLADMMRVIAEDPTFPTPQFTTDTSARGVTLAWAKHLDGSADAIDQETTR